MGVNGNRFEQTAMVVTGPPIRREAGMQESDFLDQLPDGEAQKDSGTDHIMLVSLGCFCGPKLSFKHIGRGAATLPFDWMRTRHSGLVHFLRNDFDGFFDFDTKKSVPGCNMTTYRSYYHSFWHDDPTDPGMRERYMRRIERFKSIHSSVQPVLFVRTIPTTDEIKDAPELLSELQMRHGKNACLLLIIDFQWTAKGAAIVDGYENLLFYYLSGDHHVAEDGSPAPPYCKPVLCALDWMVGKQIQAMKFSDLEKIAACADETHWGLDGLGGLKAFETCLSGPEEEPLPEGAVPLPNPLPPQDSDFLEHLAGQVPTIPDDGVTIVSLGCCGVTKRALQLMGRGREALPFDWIQVSHEGLLHFLHKGFEAPVRPGLGAGGQRPTERHGFFDCHTRKNVPGTKLMMCRSHLHSFWHDDMGQPETKAKYNPRFACFHSLGGSGRTLLFVRSVATSTEVARADELLSALTNKFGRGTCLLLIVDFQRTNPGPYVVDGHEDLLVYFFDSRASEGEDVVASYRKPIDTALDWLHGNPIEAASVADLKTLHGFADATSWGLVGLGGLNAFEGASRKVDGSDTPSTARPGAEDAWIEEAKLEAAKESVAVVSLGSHAGTAKAFKMLDLASEVSPFDQVWVRLEGVVHFLRTGFEGFFATPAAEKVPGTAVAARRTYHHSFWDEAGCAGEELKEARRRAVEHFLGPLARSDRPKLFVRALASTEELDGVGELLAALEGHFSGVCLAVIVCGQPAPRLLSVEGRYNVLVHFVVAEASLDGLAYCEPLKRSLDWAVGKPVQASVAADFASLRDLAAAWSGGLVGPGGLAAFREAN